jgi:type I restriction enzyme S subunit
MLDKAKNKGTPRRYLRNVNVRWFSFDLSDLLEMRFLDEESDRFTAVKGDVLICEGGYPGRAAIWNQDYPIHFQKAIHRVRFHEPERNKWFLYYLYYTESTGRLRQYYTGTGIQHFTGEALARLPIPLPPLPDQRRIVGILDEAFAGIATAKANAEKNLQNARDLFESHLQAVFSQRGDGWVNATLGEVCVLKSGTTVSKTLEKLTGDLPYLKVADMTHAGNESEIVSSSRFLDEADIGKNAVFPPGTTIFPKRGGAILTNKKRRTAVPICADLNIMGVIPSTDLLPKFLFFYFLNVDMRQLGSGSSIPQINNYDIEPLPISFPKSAGQQAQIVCEFEELSTQTQRLASLYQRKLAALDELKKSLLHQAFSGDL